MDPISVIREGSGPEVLLVHGGASPRTTWSALESLKPRWTLALVHGYPPSPSPPSAGHNFDVDATDLAPLLDSRPHVVAHPYGVLGTLRQAPARPDAPGPEAGLGERELDHALLQVRADMVRHPRRPALPDPVRGERAPPRASRPPRASPLSAGAGLDA